MVDMMTEEARSCAIVDAKKRPKLKPFAVRLEWASTISYCDIAVMASTPERAIKRAYRECDYDNQDNYDDGGETYCGAVVQFRTREQAEKTVSDRSLWDYNNGRGIPLKHENPNHQAFVLAQELAYMRAALQRCEAIMAEAAKTCTGTLQSQLENEGRKAAYLVANAPTI